MIILASISSACGAVALARRSSHQPRGLRPHAALTTAAAFGAALGCGDAGRAEPLELDAVRAALVDPIQRCGELTIDVDNRDPELSDQAIMNLVNTFCEVYPQERQRFNLNAPLEVSFIFTPDHPYPASARDGEITFNSKHFINNPEDWDVVTHEAMHLVQYPSLGPSWLIEGISDHVRDVYGVHNEAAGWSLQATPGKYYNAGYRDTALFLQSIERAHAPGIVDDMTAALLAESYTEDLWSTLTGLTLDQLWNEYNPSFPLPSDEVTLFPDGDYADYEELPGIEVRLGPGSHSVSDLIAAGLGDDTLSSLWVPVGLEVQLFSEGDFSGTALTFSRNVPSLVNEGANDVISSVIVTRR